MKYIIYCNGYELCTLTDHNAAWDAYESAEKLALKLNGTACLVDGNTGEVLADQTGWRA